MSSLGRPRTTTSEKLASTLDRTQGLRDSLPMSSKHDAASFASIAARLGGRLLRHHPLAGGVSARVEALEIAQADGPEVRRVVFRQPGAAEWKAPGADTARREHDLLAWLHAGGLPVPRPLLLDISCEVFPRGYFVMEHIDGTRDVGDLPDALTRMAAVLADVHRLPLANAPPLPEREDPIAGLLEFLPAEHDALRTKLLRDPPRLPTRRSMLHGDFWPGNLLWRRQELVGLLDWEDAALGDPLSDVACCRLELRYKHGPDAAERFTELYASHARVDVDELPVWDAYVAAAALTSMGQWGLDPALLAHMRNEAQAALSTAADRLQEGTIP
jgi:aminoglycoside phosphotransferase (APT) family kinase protein